jgi:hypothetical protein
MIQPKLQEISPEKESEAKCEVVNEQAEKKEEKI